MLAPPSAHLRVKKQACCKAYRNSVRHTCYPPCVCAGTGANQSTFTCFSQNNVRQMLSGSHVINICCKSQAQFNSLLSRAYKQESQCFLLYIQVWRQGLHHIAHNCRCAEGPRRHASRGEPVCKHVLIHRHGVSCMMYRNVSQRRCSLCFAASDDKDNACQELQHLLLAVWLRKVTALQFLFLLSVLVCFVVG